MGRGGAGQRWKSAGRSGAGRGEKARKSTDLKIRQKCVNCYWRICITVWCFDQGKHYILWLLNGLSANQIITSCTKDQMNSFSFISFSSPFLAQMCGLNLCNLQSALPPLSLLLVRWIDYSHHWRCYCSSQVLAPPQPFCLSSAALENPSDQRYMFLCFIHLAWLF